MKDNRTNLIGMDRGQLDALCRSLSIQSYRSKQLFSWIYNKRAKSFSNMTDISKSIRNILERNYRLFFPQFKKILECDDSKKILFLLEDGEFIEAVYIKERDHTTLCISTQVGCPIGCVFCATGRSGFRRNLLASEIVGQVLFFLDEMVPEGPINITFMGMGEPLLNYDNLVKAIDILIDPEGVGIPLRRITISTAGILNQIDQLKSRFPNIGIAFSLNSSYNDLRSKMMPVNKTNPLEKILKEFERIEFKYRNPLTIEYVLISGINDSMGEADRIADIAGRLRARVNLIPLNKIELFNGEPSDESTIQAFVRRLVSNNINVTVRRSKGQAIGAACGQLKVSSEEGTDDKEGITAG